MFKIKTVKEYDLTFLKKELKISEILYENTDDFIPQIFHNIICNGDDIHILFNKHTGDLYWRHCKISAKTLEMKHDVSGWGRFIGGAILYKDSVFISYTHVGDVWHLIIDNNSNDCNGREILYKLYESEAEHNIMARSSCGKFIFYTINDSDTVMSSISRQCLHSLEKFSIDRKIDNLAMVLLDDKEKCLSIVPCLDRLKMHISGGILSVVTDTKIRFYHEEGFDSYFLSHHDEDSYYCRKFNHNRDTLAACHNDNYIFLLHKKCNDNTFSLKIKLVVDAYSLDNIYQIISKEEIFSIWHTNEIDPIEPTDSIELDRWDTHELIRIFSKKENPNFVIAATNEYFVVSDSNKMYIHMLSGKR